MLDCDRDLNRHLQRIGVYLDILDDNTLILRNVPACQHVFSKSRVGLLLKRSAETMPFIVCVDEDVEYMGADPGLLRVFTAGTRREGWRVLFMQPGANIDTREAIFYAIDVFSKGVMPHALAASVQKAPIIDKALLLATFGQELSVPADNMTVTIGRSREVEEVASCVVRWSETRLPVILGHSGVGKTNLLHGVAAKLSHSHKMIRIIRINLAVIFAGTMLESERGNLFSTLLDEIVERQDFVLALEHIDLAVSEVRYGAILLSNALDRGAHIIGTALVGSAQGLETEPLGRRLHFVDLPEITPSEALSVLRIKKESIEQHHHVEIDEQVLSVCIGLSQNLLGYLPAKALALLDSAAARAAISGTSVVGPEDIYYAAARCCSGERSE